MNLHPLELPECDARNEYLWCHWITRGNEACQRSRIAKDEASKCFERAREYRDRISPARLAEIDAERLQRARAH